MKLLNYQLEPFKQRLKTFCIWGAWVGVAFFGLYPLLNLFTSQRSQTFGLYLPIELQIPFLPSFIWLYFSMYLLLITPLFCLNTKALKRLAIELIMVTIIAAIIFLIIPCHLGFTRVIPNNSFYQLLYSQMFTLDYPHNLVPSLHVAYSATITLNIIPMVKKYLRYALYLWLIAIISSTILTHQHHLLDVIAGFGLPLLIHNMLGRYYEKNYNCAVYPN